VAVLFLRNVRLPSAGLYPVASVATGALAFGAAQSLDASGFLAVYLAGLVLGTVSTPARRTIVTFHDGLAWVAQLGLFLTLGLLVFPHQLGDNAPQSIAIAVVTAVVARPVAAVVATALSHFSLREQLMLGWAGLRGATPIVFATFPVTEHVENGHLIFNVAFFVVLLSTVLQGLTIEPAARALGVTSDEAAIPEPLVEPVPVLVPLLIVPEPEVEPEPLEEPVAGAELAAAGEERAGPVGRIVVGRSASLSFQEAFANAVSQIPVQAFADALLRVRVEEIGGEFGGIAGFHHLYVKVRVV
jgi:hypothetical protein